MRSSSAMTLQSSEGKTGPSGVTGRVEALTKCQKQQPIGQIQLASYKGKIQGSFMAVFTREGMVVETTPPQKSWGCQLPIGDGRAVREGHAQVTPSYFLLELHMLD